jgi:large subunit ribosomal protein L22e
LFGVFVFFRLNEIQEKFLQDRIKINGKTGVLGDAVVISREGQKIVVTAEMPFSKRSLKYLTKKYLKKQSLRDYLRIIADQKNKNTYKICYFPMADDGADEAEE